MAMTDTDDGMEDLLVSDDTNLADFHRHWITNLTKP